MEIFKDLLQRVDGVVQALLLNTDVLVVSHQAVLRCIMAYFKGSRPGWHIKIISSLICESKLIAFRLLEDIPYINVPLHTLLVVKSFGYDFEIETVPLKGKSILGEYISLAFGYSIARASVL